MSTIFCVPKFIPPKKKMASLGSAALSHKFPFSRGIVPVTTATGLLLLLLLLLSLPAPAVARAASTRSDHSSPSAQQTALAGFERRQDWDVNSGSFSNQEGQVGYHVSASDKDFKKVVAQFVRYLQDFSTFLNQKGDKPRDVLQTGPEPQMKLSSVHLPKLQFGGTNRNHARLKEALFESENGKGLQEVQEVPVRMEILAEYFSGSLDRQRLSGGRHQELAATSEEKVKADGVKERPRRLASDVSGSWGDAEGQWISHLCAAQCDACTQNTGACQTPCRDNKTRTSWTTLCPTRQRQFQDFNELEQAYQTIDVGCPGTCSILRNQNDASYFIPMTPEVVLVRDMRNRSLTLTWSRPGNSEPVVYVVQEREQKGFQGIRRWSAAHLVMGGDHFTRYNLDVCSTPVYRVAAVSRFGARWFSHEVVAPVITPEKPQMFRVTGSAFDTSFNEFTIELSWETPRGFTLTDLRPGNPYTFQGRAVCAGRIEPEVFVQEIHLGDLENTLTFHVAEEVLGCGLVLELSATSSCDDRLESEPSYLTLNFSCIAVQGFYSGSKCRETYAYVPPMNVADVRVTLLPTGQSGGRAHVTWSPPPELGSEGRVDYYVVFYGVVNPIFSWGFNGSYGNMTVPGNILQADVVIPSPDDDSIRFGILVMPGVNSHEIAYPIGIMHIVPRPSFSNGSALVEDEDLVVYYNQEAPDSVQVFWSRPGPRDGLQGEPAGAALLWGRVSPRGVGDDVREGSNVTDLGAGQVDWLPDASFVVVDGNQTSYTIQHLTVEETYGLKIMFLYGNESHMDEDTQDRWEHLSTHLFYLPQAPLTASVTAAVATSTREVTLVVAWVVPILVTLVTVVMVTVALWLWRRKGRALRHLTRLQSKDARTYTYLWREVSPGEEPATAVPDEWELPGTAIRLGPVLGAGAFGQVVLGRVSRALLRHRGLPSQYWDPTYLPQPLLQGGQPLEDGHQDQALFAPVAIKMLKEDCEDSGKEEFLREITLMKALGHHAHVVSMLGCCTLREPYCLLVEHMCGGDLLHYLKRLRKGRRLPQAPRDSSGEGEHMAAEIITSRHLLSLAWQVSQGMEYITNKGYVHRDLAARNVLIGQNGEVKVGDFGLARYVYTDNAYVSRKGGKLPLKWMAVESIFDLTFTSASDVWSFGVLLFEIATLGGTPYPTVDVKDLLVLLKRGYRMERPNTCSEELYRMMQQCWLQDPAHRPTFSALGAWLQDMLHDPSGVAYLDPAPDLASPYYNCPRRRRKHRLAEEGVSCDNKDSDINQKEEEEEEEEEGESDRSLDVNAVDRVTSLSLEELSALDAAVAVHRSSCSTSPARLVTGGEVVAATASSSDSPANILSSGASQRSGCRARAVVSKVQVHRAATSSSSAMSESSDEASSFSSVFISLSSSSSSFSSLSSMTIVSDISRGYQVDEVEEEEDEEEAKGETLAVNWRQAEDDAHLSLDDTGRPVEISLVQLQGQVSARNRLATEGRDVRVETTPSPLSQETIRREKRHSDDSVTDEADNDKKDAVRNGRRESVGSKGDGEADDGDDEDDTDVDEGGEDSPPCSTLPHSLRNVWDNIDSEGEVFISTGWRPSRQGLETLILAQKGQGRPPNWAQEKHPRGLYRARLHLDTAQSGLLTGSRQAERSGDCAALDSQGESVYVSASSVSSAGGEGPEAGSGSGSLFRLLGPPPAVALATVVSSLPGLGRTHPSPPCSGIAPRHQATLSRHNVASVFPSSALPKSPSVTWKSRYLRS